MMKVRTAPQGSADWLADRAGHYNAADAAAMLGCDPNGRTRTQLLDEIVVGFAPDASAFKQRLFDKGHQVEAMMRPLAETIIGEDLYPLVGGMEIGLSKPLGASFDGVTIARDTNFEAKSLNEALAAAMPVENDPDGNDAANLPKGYRVQMEQQQIVDGATRTLFGAGSFNADGSVKSLRWCWYTSDAALREEILAGWKQLDEDAKTHAAKEVAEMPSPEVTIALPALFIHAKGEITTSNMKEYGEALAVRLKEVRAIQLITDQDFSNAKESAKLLRENIEQARLAKAAMLAQTVTVGEAANMIDAWCEDMRLTALQLEKDVEREDKAKKTAMIDATKLKYAEHIRELDQEITPARITLSIPVFAEAIKNKRSFASMQDALDTMLAKAKIAANEQAATIRHNREQLRPQNGVAGEDWISLFPDFSAVCAKPRDDFHNLVTARVAAHRQRLEAERERIREEEADKLRKEQEAAAERERDRIRQEEADKLRKEENDAAAAAASALAASRKQEVFTPELQTALEGVTAELTADLTIGRAANSSRVVPLSARGKPTLRLGEINDRIAPLAITEAGLAKLGFPAAARERSACMYHECDLPAMLDSTIAHLRMVQQRATEAEAA